MHTLCNVEPGAGHGVSGSEPNGVDMNFQIILANMYT